MTRSSGETSVKNNISVLIILLLFFFSLSTGIKPALANAHEKTFGILTRNTNEQTLLGLLPHGQMQRTLYDIGDGDFRCVSEIFPKSEKNALIVWKSDTRSYEPYNDKRNNVNSQLQCERSGSRNTIQYIIINQNSTYWQNELNIHVGMTLDELVATNQAPITFSICDCHYGGDVQNWHQGQIKDFLWVHLNYDIPAKQMKFENFYRNSHENILSSELSSEIRSSISIDRIVIDLDAIDTTTHTKVK